MLEVERPDVVGVLGLEPVRRRGGLIADRSWPSRTQVELAVVEYIAWFNSDRLHESLGDLSPVEFEGLYVAQEI